MSGKVKNYVTEKVDREREKTVMDESITTTNIA